MHLPTRMLSVLSLILASAAAGADKPRLDAHGDPLPDGALARLGTARFRGSFKAVALSPDGKTLAMSTERSLSFRDLTSGRTIKTIAIDRELSPITSLAFSPNGKWLACMRYRTGIHLLEVGGGWTLRQISTDETIRPGSVVFSADGRLMSAGGDIHSQQEPTIRVWEVATGKEIAAVKPLQNKYVFASFSPDGKVLATWGMFMARKPGDGDEEQGRIRTVQLWDTSTGKELKRLQGIPAAYVTSVALAPGGKRAVICYAGLMSLWDLETGKELEQLAACRNTRICVFSPDGKLLIGLSYSLLVQIWDAATGRRLGVYEVPGWDLNGDRSPLVFAHDGRLLAITENGHAVSVWDVREEKLLTPASGHGTTVLALAFAAGGKCLHSASADGTICRWDVTSGKEVGRHKLRNRDSTSSGRSLGAALVSPNGKYLFSTNSSNSLLWELANGREVCEFHTDSDSDSNAAYSADSTRVVFPGRNEDREARVLEVRDIPTGRRLARLTGTWDTLTSLAMAPDGNTVAASTFSRRRNLTFGLHVWDANSGKSRWSSITRRRGAGALAFSPNGAALAMGDHRNEVVFLHPATGEEQWRVPADGADWIHKLVFSPDGRTLAAVTSSKDDRCVILVLELATGTVRHRLIGHEASVDPPCLTFSPDGTTLATGSSDTTVLLWDLTGRLGREKPKVPPGQRELDALWADLDAPDAKKALEAQAKLHLSPAEAVTLLARKLPPVKGVKPDAATIAKLVADLDNARFEPREKARRDLEALGPAAAAELRKALENKPSLEMRKRIEDLLQRLDTLVIKPEWVRPIRAVELVERLGTPEAKELLEKWSDGAPGSRLTQEAVASLRRLNAPKP